jgi:5-methylcytosine-specific restriction protein A
MDNILREPLIHYLTEKQTTFGGNALADKFRHLFPDSIAAIIPDKTRYKVVGSPGQGQWTECPWIAIFDILITDSAQSGYYPVFLFKADMSGVYLSLNQGVTEVKDYYKRDTRNVLRLRAQDFRAKIDLTEEDLLEINLNAKGDAKLYEDGNIIAKYYPADSIPNNETLSADIFRYLNLYEELAFNDTKLNDEKELTAIEKKQFRLHFRIERNSAISKKVKAAKGYLCEACNFNFKTKYGDLGERFIEAHHLKPIASLGIGQFQVNIQTDFAVLCSDCHSMIHRLDDPSDLNKLKTIVSGQLI